MCIINTTYQDLLLRQGQIVAELFQVERTDKAENSAYVITP